MAKLLVVKSKLYVTPVGGILPFSFYQKVPGIVLAEAGKKHIAKSMILSI